MKDKQHRRSSFLFSLLLVVFVASLWLIGGVVAPILDRSTPLGLVRQSPFDTFLTTVQHHMHTSIGILLLQIIVILTAVRFVGWIFKKLKQPTVIGEIVAGILLGPSLLGWLWPEAMEWLFPQKSLPNLELLSQFGLILFMFTIGMDLRIKDIKVQARQALVISQAGIFIPFLLGMTLSALVYRNNLFTVPFVPFTLFCGIAMSITAFPVLARIIQERGMGRSPLGKLALSTAAAGDIVAWLMLAAVMAVTQSGNFSGALFNMLFLTVYLLFMFFVVRPLFNLIGQLYNRKEVVSRSIVGIIFTLLLISSYLTDILSMHALIGAFLLGLIMPEDLRFRGVINEKVEDVSLTLFLPLFFVSSGLQTHLGLINSGPLWLLFVLFTMVAIIGKIGGTYLYARVCNVDKKESLYLGVLMNTRGLMELVVLRIGLDLGVLPPVIFAILVLMTLVTTFMTTPLMQFIDFIHFRISKKRNAVVSIPKLKVLISFGRPDTGIHLMRLAHQMFHTKRDYTDLSLLHITMNSDVNPIDEENFYQENFSPVLQEAARHKIQAQTLHRVSNSPSDEIIRTANKGQYDFLLVGAGLNLSGNLIDKELISYHKHLQKRWQRFSISSPEALLSAKHMFQDKMSSFVSLTECSVGIYINRSNKTPHKVLLPIYNEVDLKLLPYAYNVQSINKASLSVLPLLSEKEANCSICPQIPQGNFSLLEPAMLGQNMRGYDLLIISYGTWNLLLDQHLEELDYLPSTIIIHSNRPVLGHTEPRKL